MFMAAIRHRQKEVATELVNIAAGVTVLRFLLPARVNAIIPAGLVHVLRGRFLEKP